MAAWFLDSSKGNVQVSGQKLGAFKSVTGSSQDLLGNISGNIPGVMDGTSVSLEATGAGTGGCTPDFIVTELDATTASFNTAGLAVKAFGIMEASGNRICVTASDIGRLVLAAETEGGCCGNARAYS